MNTNKNEQILESILKDNPGSQVPQEVEARLRRHLKALRDRMEEPKGKELSATIRVLWRTFMKTKKTAFITASMIVIVALIVFQFIGNPVGPGLTFASVIEPILKAKTAAYDMVFGPDDGSRQAVHELVMNSRIRRQVAGSSAVTIIDLENRRVLFRNEANMEARYGYIDPKGMASGQNYPNGMVFSQNYLEELKNIILSLKDMPDFTVEELGRKQLDGREVIGFFASHPKLDITIWADVDTGLPVRIEYNVGTVHVTYKNMEFDLLMDEEMFSMEVPAGYMVQEPLTMDLQVTEENFIKGLRLIAEKLNHGLFPNDVSYESFSRWMTSGPINSQFDAMAKEEALAINLELIKFIRFTIFFPGEGKWTYRGNGVRLGEAESPIFWYKPEKSETYRVIYGDLHVENIAPEKLPQ
ncbi:MAG: hypothetical protein JW927_12620 [Deltaproteobacteria bacterium]|nr:hypothetical protein [Deltaproteobacteria bacterium]